MEEHNAWRSLCATKQVQFLRRGLQPIKTAHDVCRALINDGVGDDLGTTTCPTPGSWMCICVSAALTSVDPERGFSLMKLILTRLRSRLGELRVEVLMFIASHAPSRRGGQTSANGSRIVRISENRYYLSPNCGGKPDVKLPKKKKAKQATIRSSFRNAAQKHPLAPSTDSLEAKTEEWDTDRVDGFLQGSCSLPRPEERSPDHPWPFRFSLIDLGQYPRGNPAIPSCAFLGPLCDRLQFADDFKEGSIVCTTISLLVQYAEANLVSTAELQQRMEVPGDPVRSLVLELLSTNEKRELTAVHTMFTNVLPALGNLVMHQFSWSTRRGRSSRPAALADSMLAMMAGNDSTLFMRVHGGGP